VERFEILSASRIWLSIAGIIKRSRLFRRRLAGERRRAIELAR